LAGGFYSGRNSFAFPERTGENRIGRDIDGISDSVSVMIALPSSTVNTGHALRWQIAFLVSAAIAISYLDRQTLPIAIGEIARDIPISNTVKANLDSAFLLTYGLMYVGGGRLMDILGTRRGFLWIMIFWSVACASHGIAGGVLMLAASRLLLGVGEGGGFPAATRVVAEWFPAKDRATAMGIINAGTGIGGIVAPPLIAWIILNTGWLGLSSWRWVFFITGALGLIWTIWWWRSYFPPGTHPRLSPMEREHLRPILEKADAPQRAPIPIRELLRFRETWGVIGAKFLTDAAWYFYMFWLPKYLLDARGFNIKAIGSVAWIPFAAAAVGCLVGGGLSSGLLHRGYSVNASRKIALGLSAAIMPCVMLVPHVSVPWVIFLFSVAFFGQQSWSTLVMILPTDLFPKHALGTVAGFVGLGGALGGVVLGKTAGYLLDHGFSYTPVLIIAGSLHVLAFFLISTTVRSLQPLPLKPQYLAS
jgi:MFS transporter, ACS family, hexuronate transporter